MSQPLASGIPVFCKFDRLAAPEQLKPHPDNAHRSHPEAQLDRYEAVIKGNGWRKSVVVSRKSGFIVKGHGAWMTAARRGWQIPIELQSYASIEEERRDLLADNRLALDAVTDDAKLALLLSELSADDLTFAGYDNIDLQKLIAASQKGAAGEGAEPQIDKAAELQKKWGVERGQIWLLGKHRLMCGDSTLVNDVAALVNGESVRYGIHDPPYGISVVGGTKPFGSVGGTNTVRANRYAPIQGDDTKFDPRHLIDASPDVVIWGANYFADKLPCRKGWLVWDKKGREWNDNFSDCELAWTSLQTVAKIYRFVWMGMVQGNERETRQHPTQKPTALFRQIISDLFKDGGTIIDYFLGSGTTLIACEQLGRVCRAMEIDPGYVAVAIQRWVDTCGGTPVIEGTAGRVARTSARRAQSKLTLTGARPARCGSLPNSAKPSRKSSRRISSASSTAARRSPRASKRS